VSELIIKTEGLTKHYVLGAETVKACRSVDLTIEKGEFVAIMGPSGSGKSTFMNMIGCLDTPTTGDYWLNGQKVSDLTDDQLARVRTVKSVLSSRRSTCSLVRRRFTTSSCSDLRGCGGKERRRRAVEKLELVGLGDRMDHRPPEMSGGQRQRVAVARALVNNPALLLADEPTGNLDSVTSADIMRQLGELNKAGQTIVIVTHEHDIAEHAKRQVHLKDGFVEQDFMNEPAETLV